MFETFLLINCLLLFLVIGVLIWLYFAYQKLNRDNLSLKQEIDRTNRDLAGLCSAAVNVDTRLSANGDLLQEVLKEMAVSEQNSTETSGQPYQDIIQMVRNGADSTELVRQCGVSFDEAALLIRLHGVEKME